MKGYVVTLACLKAQAADPLLALIGAVARDPRPNKIDLTVGVYRDEDGRTPVLASVKEAERRLLVEQSSKSYLGSQGDGAFVEALLPLIFGAGTGAAVSGIQTPGGTGALRAAADVLALGDRPRTLWLGVPTWGNHPAIARAAGVAVRTFAPIDFGTQTFRLDAALEALSLAEPGDVLLLQACCHNPTGIDPKPEDWQALAAFAAQRGLVPLLDMAYQGLGDGLEADAALVRHFAAHVPEMLLAYSCNKNFALYRDRVGAMFVVAADAGVRARTISNALALVRTSWSMPPDHGAAVVRTILHDRALTAQWHGELERMRGRIHRVRAAVAAHGRAGPLPLEAIARQKGMFSVLPLQPETIERLRREHGIYMAPDGRINLAGLSLAAVDRLIAALDAALTGDAGAMEAVSCPAL